MLLSTFTFITFMMITFKSLWFSSWCCRFSLESISYPGSTWRSKSLEQLFSLDWFTSFSMSSKDHSFEFLLGLFVYSRNIFSFSELQWCLHSNSPSNWGLDHLKVNLLSFVIWKTAMPTSMWGISALMQESWLFVEIFYPETGRSTSS